MTILKFGTKALHARKLLLPNTDIRKWMKIRIANGPVLISHQHEACLTSNQKAIAS